MAVDSDIILPIDEVRRQRRAAILAGELARSGPSVYRTRRAAPSQLHVDLALVDVQPKERKRRPPFNRISTKQTGRPGTKRR